jgi:hypothetical protein
MKAKVVVLALAALICTATSALALNFSFTGNLTKDNDVQLFNFSVGAPSNVTLRTWSYAGGTNAAGSVIARGGFDPILALFDSSGAFISQNDDGGSNVPGDAVTGAHYDTFLTSSLAAGNYTVAVMQFDNFANGPQLSNGFERDGASFNNFRNGFFDVTGDKRDSHWAFDILNVDEAIVVGNPVPEPSTLFLLGAGLGGLILARRRAKKA